ncbi:HOOK protein-domain-containing protein [Limtongia smithiae]|uniref:HOOK protein-domain-containing protein n=1 Tax=Limtongia smithiae TaxID=1125753 RepID=UPI0034CDA83D
MAAPGDQKESAFISWINVLSSSTSSEPISSLTVLSDGALISKILNTIDRDYFKSLIVQTPGIDDKPSFMVNVRNLKKLDKALETYLYGVATPSADDRNSTLPNVSLIAKDANTEEIIKLLILVLLAAARQPDSEAFRAISAVQNDEEKRLLGDLAVARKETDSAKEANMKSLPVVRTLAQDRAASQYSTLEAAHAELQEHNSILQESYEKLLKRNEDLRQRLEQSDSRLKVQVDVAESKSKSQIEFLQTYVQELEEQMQIRDKRLAEAENKLLEISGQFDEVQGELDSVEHLKDRLDEIKHDNEKLRRTAIQLDKYKKQAEQAEETQRQLHTARNEITYLVEKSKLLDEDSQQVFGLRKQLEVQQKEVDFYRRKSYETDASADRLRSELNFTRERLLTLEDEHTRDTDIISTLEENIRKLKAALEEKELQHVSGIEANDEQDLEFQMTAEYYRQEVLKLQDELAELRAGNVSQTSYDTTGTTFTNPMSQSSQTSTLETALRDTMQEKDKLQDDYLQVYQEKLVLQSQVDAIDDNFATEGSSVLIQLRSALQEAEDKLQDTRAELDKLKELHGEVQRQLEEAVFDLNSVDKEKRDILTSLRQSVSKQFKALQVDYKEVQKQKAKFEAEAQKQTDLLAKTLLDKESMYQRLTEGHEELLEVSRANTTLRMTLLSLEPSGGGSYESELKSWVIDLQKKLEVQRDKMQKAQVVIKKLKQEVEGHKSLLARGPKKVRTPSIAELLFALKIVITDEEAQALRREAALMKSAWLSLASRVQQNKVIISKKVQESPKSWLNRQRKILEDYEK